MPYKEEDLVVDCAGYTIVPGFCGRSRARRRGCRFQRRRRRGVAQYGEVPADEGSSFCPTTMTVSDAEILKALETIRSCMDDKEGAKIVGVEL